MAAQTSVPELSDAPSGLSLDQRLEGGEVLYFPVCPFALPQAEDRAFLLSQHLAGRSHKNISYEPRSHQVAGFRRQGTEQEERLTDIMAAFSRAAAQWLADLLPRYARRWRLDQASYRPEEEALRQLRLTARNDLLHVDSFPSRPTQGDLILRCFANINHNDPRIWITSEPFGRLLEKYGKQVGLPTSSELGWTSRVQDEVLRLFQPARAERSVYDAFMLRFHNWLKANELFQEHAPKRRWTFAPGSTWVVFTDITSHAALRGRYALEHSFFVSPAALANPGAAPIAILESACGVPVARRAA